MILNYNRHNLVNVSPSKCFGKTMKYYFVTGLLLLLLTDSTVYAEQTDKDAAQFFESVMSPYCPGMTLSACPSDDARLLRDEIRGQLEKGETKEKIQADLKTRFGNLSGGPATEALSGMAYLGILVFFVIGLGIIGLTIGNKRRGSNV